MPSQSTTLPDQLSSLPRLQELAFELRLGINELRGRLINQGIYAGPDDRLPPSVVFDALQAELDAGRGWRPETLERFRAA